MARRRFQNPKPFVRGAYWFIRPWKDEFKDGKLVRRRGNIKLAPASMKEREVLKIASEKMRPMNQALESIGSAMRFSGYVEVYKRDVLVTITREGPSRDRYIDVIDRHLVPAFGDMCLRDLTVATVRGYFAGLSMSALGAESVRKIRTVLSSILKSAVECEYLVKTPMDAVKPPKKQVAAPKPFISCEEFDELIEQITEPYATMVYVAVWSGLRISELVGLRWNDVRTNSLTVDERYCRGHWGLPKSSASHATIAVDREVIQRIEALRTMKVTIRWGAKGAKKEFPAVKKSGPNDLVFQSVKKGAEMRDNNVLSRHIKPVARKIGRPEINWQCLRRSRATWMVEAGADPKSVQAQMRHAKIATTMDVYAQVVSDAQRRAVELTSQMAARRRAEQQAMLQQMTQGLPN